MKNAGDLHNFGKKVLFTELNGVRGYSKPRTVFWEWLFFGMDSPFRELLTTPLLDPESKSLLLTDFFFQLNVTRVSPVAGFIESVKTAQITSDENYFFRFGALLAYCFAFGIQDLHHENVILTASGPQPIDAEIIFSDLKLPDQTHLLRRRSQGGDDTSALSRLVVKPSSLAPDFFFSLLDGFVQSLNVLSAHADALNQCLRRTLVAENEAPRVRVLLRPTASYRQALNGSALPANLIAEERVQLERGDIPYFFKFYGSSQIYFMSSADTLEKVSHAVDSFTNANETATRNFEGREILSALLPQGALFLLRNNLALDWCGTKIFHKYQIACSKERCELQINARSFACAR